jgi:IS30 family transposase
MSYYIQLTQEERYHISVLCKEGYSKTDTARKTNRHISTISRELNRNTGKKGYRPKQAQEKALKRRYTSRKAIKFTDKLRQIVDKKISEQYSPDQISGKLKMSGIHISHEWIYKYLLDDKRNGGQLYQNLRHSRRKRKKRYGSHERRGQIPNRVAIDKRPEIVDTRRRIGDWEADTIIGRNHKGAMVTLVERKSKYTLIRRINRKTSLLLNNAVSELTKNIKERFITMTVDNGSEFAGHEKITSKLGVAVYFAHPYHSWERGLSENTNGLIRQYFPKKTDFREVSDKEVLLVQHRLNNRPRKTLGYLTPNEVFNNIKTNRNSCTC